MSLSLAAATLALGPNLQTYFLGSGGTPPYNYVVLAGGAGGSINATSGLYTAPAVVQAAPEMLFDIVQVVDAVSDFFNLSILVGNPLMLFCDIIQKELGLDIGQVYLWDQKIDIPTDDRLYIAIGVLSCKPFGNSISYDGSGSGLSAVQSVNMQATLSVDILSRGVEARDRKEEIILALQSNYAQSQQETNSFYIAKISSGFVNLSQIDGAAIPYRFNISVNMQYSVRKTQAVPYYDTFTDVAPVTES